MKEIKEILKEFVTKTSDDELLAEQELRNQLENHFPFCQIWIWNCYGDEETRFYVIDKNDICKYVIYPYRAKIEKVNKHIKEVDPYFYKEIYK